MKRTFVSGIVFVLLFTACATTSTPPTVDVNAFQTSAFSTAWEAQGQTGTASVPTSTPIPSDTPAPTDTPIPTATPNPNLISAGTYLVGSDIQPGIYRGYGGDNTLDSCYWARLSDLTGDFSALLANDNAVGQFYVEVKQTDKAFEVGCGAERLVSLPLPQPASTFPSSIVAGTYLVGIDIQPGTYKGQAGTDITESCYWERLSNVSGDFSGLIANDNSTGQYYVQVASTDFALKTGCPLERTGN